MKLLTRGLALDVHEFVGSGRKQMDASGYSRSHESKYEKIHANTFIYCIVSIKYCFSVFDTYS